MNPQLVDWSPALRLLLLAATIAALPLAWWWLRQRGADSRRRLAALTALTLFLCFDLIVFGSFTRLSDSGLGCPDWPGCYGQVSPFGAQQEIDAAHSAAPGGPVSWSKAWIEMIHRYLAMTVGALILALAAVSWQLKLRHGRAPIGVVWPTLTLVWVIVQGLFGKYTVTLKLYPAVVTLHLLGGLLLLALLAAQLEALRQRPLALARPLRIGAAFGLALLAAQVALGGWVSSNYAVLACSGFPQCNGSWWPAMDARGFSLLRGLGEVGAGGALTQASLVAIQMAHRGFALVVFAVLGLLVWKLWRVPGAATRGYARALALLLLAQLASGLSNVLLGWPLLAALAHSAGAAALVLTLVLLLTRTAAGRGAPAPTA